VHRPFVHHYIAVSRELASYLTGRVRVPVDRVSLIGNGVDAVRFHPAATPRIPVEGMPFTDPSLWLVGTVGRMESVKDQTNLVRAFIRAVQIDAEAKRRMRLLLVGDGPQRQEVERAIDEAGVRALVWLAGERSDIPEILRGFDLFVLPSLAEGISNTILEAMASGLSVVATKVGGNPELLEPGLTGELVPPADPESLARAILRYFKDPRAARRHGSAGRSRVERQYSLDRMIADYDRLYRRLLEQRGLAPSLRQA
jgi:sugar transferase (PEP-CTERM/EpsH1 system associated)